MLGGIKGTFSGFSSLGGSGGKVSRSRRMVFFVVLIVLALLVLVLLAAGRRGGEPLEPLAILPQQRGAPPKISETYKNPFERETQYVNPFADFKSPFQALQQ